MREGRRGREEGRGNGEERENRQKKSTRTFEEVSISITYFGVKSKPHTKSQNCCAKSLTPFHRTEINHLGQGGSRIGFGVLLSIA